METLSSLAKVCRCPQWVTHVPLVGKSATEAAGAYPEELTDAIAAKVMDTWKRTLNLDWLRHQMTVKAGEVNELQKKCPS